jgi:hypothetical protein
MHESEPFPDENGRFPGEKREFSDDFTDEKAPIVDHGDGGSRVFGTRGMGPNGAWQLAAGSRQFAVGSWLNSGRVAAMAVALIPALYKVRQGGGVNCVAVWQLGDLAMLCIVSRLACVRRFDRAPIC